MPRRFILVAVYLFTLALLTAGSFFVPDGLISSGLQFDDKTLAKTALDALTDLQQFVGALNTTLFGACGWLVIKGRETKTRWSNISGYAIVLALAAGTTSYYGLYLARIAILEMVSAGVLDPLTRRLQFALGLQYYGFLVGAVLLGLVFVRLLEVGSESA